MKFENRKKPDRPRGSQAKAIKDQARSYSSFRKDMRCPSGYRPSSLISWSLSGKRNIANRDEDKENANTRGGRQQRNCRILHRCIAAGTCSLWFPFTTVQVKYAPKDCSQTSTNAFKRHQSLYPQSHERKWCCNVTHVCLSARIPSQRKRNISLKMSASLHPKRSTSLHSWQCRQR